MAKCFSLQCAVSVVMLTAMVLQPGLAANALRAASFDCDILRSCTCPGHIYKCQCTTVGPGVTVWSGTLFNGSSDCSRIILHRDLTPSECGGFTARGISIIDGYFTSQMNLTLTPDYDGKTVDCILYNVDRETVIGVHTINFTSVSLPPPQKVRLSALSNQNLHFSWDRVTNCSTTSYSIQFSENCGVCTIHTTNINATCILPKLSDRLSVCTLRVQAVTCDNYLGIQSNAVRVNLKLPNAPQINNIRESYDFRTNQRTQVYVEFAHEDNFTIFEKFNGSVSSYKIHYTDYDAGSECGTTMIASSDCKKGVCTHVHDTLKSPCATSTDVKVSIFGYNMFGKGPASKSSIGIIDSGKEKSSSQNSSLIIGIIILVILVISLSIMLFFSTKLKLILKRFLPATRLNKHRNNKHLKEINQKTALIYDTKANSKCSMLDFTQKILPGYDPEWGCGYYQLVETRELSSKVNVILKYKDHTQTGEEGRFVYKQTSLRNLLDNKDLHDFSVKVSCTITEWPMVYIQSKSYEEQLKQNQHFLFCAPLTEVVGHHKMCKVPKKECETCDTTDTQGRTVKSKGCKDCTELLSQFAKKEYESYSPGFGYYEYDPDSMKDTKENKRVMIDIEGKLYRGEATKCLLGGDTSSKPLYQANQHKWNHLFIHSSGYERRLVPETYFMFCIELDKISESYWILVNVGDQDTKMIDIIERSDVQLQKGNMCPLGTYYQLGEEKKVIKHFILVILMDQEQNLFTGEYAHRVIGNTQIVNKVSAPSLEGTDFKCTFIQSSEDNTILRSGTKFLYCAPLKIVGAFFSIHPVRGQPKLLEFARGKIPGFDPVSGFGYYEYKPAEHSVIFSTELNLILMAKKEDDEYILYTGPGAFDCAQEILKINYPDQVHQPVQSHEERVKTSANIPLKNWTIFIQSKLSEQKLLDGTRFLYCEYDKDSEKTM